MKLIPHSKPWITAEDIASVSTALASGLIGQGDQTHQLEQRLSAWFGLHDHAVAVSTGAAAIKLALHALEVQPRDEVVLPTYVCRSVAEAIHSIGATPVYCDVGPQWVVTPENMAPHITSATRALIVPHMYGIFADVKGFRSFGIPILEDSAQALGAAGSRSIEGDIATLSFHPTKCLTTGEGGMALSPHPERVEKMRRLREGGTRLSERAVFAPLSDLAAALGLSQLGRYPCFLTRREQYAARYRALLDEVDVTLLCGFPWQNTMLLRLPFHLDGGLAACQEAFAQRGIAARKGVDQLLHRLAGLPDAGFETAVKLFERTVSLPLYPALTDDELMRCLTAARDVLVEQR